MTKVQESSRRVAFSIMLGTAFMGILPLSFLLVLVSLPEMSLSLGGVVVALVLGYALAVLTFKTRTGQAAIDRDAEPQAEAFR